MSRVPKVMHLYSAGGVRPLAERLAELLAVGPTDPFTPEWLAVPSDGLRRWLTLELARHLGASRPGAGDGIAANIIRAFPGDLRNQLLAIDRPQGETSPWRIERMVWPVLEAIDGAEHGMLPAGLAALDSQREGASLYAKGRRVADLFDRYHQYRPHMIRQWARGQLVDGAGRALDEPTSWQALLWQHVRARIGEPSPPEQLPTVLRRLHAGEDPLALPPRLILFGFTLLPAGAFLDVVRAVGVSRQVHVFMLEPTHYDPRQLLQAHPATADGLVRLRSNDATASLVAQPLLRSWGRLHRETALQLADVQTEGLPVERLDVPEPASRDTLLGRLQSDLRANRAPEPTLGDDPSDDSVRFHACFGAIRQVEVLRDALLHLLAEEGTDLTEDDIVVLCPTLDRFAPLVEAAFGRSAPATSSALGDRTYVSVAPGESPTGEPYSALPEAERQGAPALRYRLADRSIRTTNPVLSAASALFELVSGRFDADAVLDFVALGPVRERFGFDDDSLGVIGEWVEGTNVRWGLDPAQREPLGLPGSVATNTWAAAIDRLLMGSAVFDVDLQLSIGDVAPFGVEGDDLEVIGSLAAIMSCLAELADGVDTPRPLAAWIERIRSTCSVLFAAERDQAWQTEALYRILGEVVESSVVMDEPSSVPLAFGDVWKLLDERLDDKVGRADFFRGGITVTSLTPLRWLPFRVVCLLGLDQSAFGAESSAGDDLSALVPMLGDRDPRGEVRQSLLEAVLAAGDHLIVVREGHDIRTNQVVPRAVPTTELYEAFLASVTPEERAVVAERLETEHPRQPYDARCFEPGRFIPDRPWGFDTNDLSGARARRKQSLRRVPFLSRPLEPVDSDVVELSALHRFFRNPTTAFLGSRLEVRVPSPEEDTPTALSVDIAGLAGWNVGTRLLEARLGGWSYDEWLRYERQLGTLPPSPLGEDALAELQHTVEAMLTAARLAGVTPGPPRPFAVDARLADGTRVVGSVALRLGQGDEASGPAEFYYSRFKPSHRLAAWLDLMALAATDPDRPWRALAVSRPASGADPTVNDLVPAPVGSETRIDPIEALTVAVDCYRRGMSEPLPLFPKVSFELFRGLSARNSWKGYKFPGEGDQLAVRLAFDDHDFEGITSLPTQPGDPGVGKDRARRFAVYLYRTIAQSTAARSGETGTAKARSKK